MPIKNYRLARGISSIIYFGVSSLPEFFYENLDKFVVSLEHEDITCSWNSSRLELLKFINRAMDDSLKEGYSPRERKRGLVSDIAFRLKYSGINDMESCNEFKEQLLISFIVNTYLPLCYTMGYMFNKLIDPKNGVISELKFIYAEIYPRYMDLVELNWIEIISLNPCLNHPDNEETKTTDLDIEPNPKAVDTKLSQNNINTIISSNVSFSSPKNNDCYKSVENNNNYTTAIMVTELDFRETY